LFLDAVADRPARSSFAAASRRRPSRLRIAVSLRVQSRLIAPLSREVVGGVRMIGELLRDLGHQVVDRDPSYPLAATKNQMVRYLRGLYDDAGELANYGRLERRSKRMIRLGGIISPRTLQRALRDEAAVAQRLFAEFDVLLTHVVSRPPIPAARYHGKGAFRSLLGAGRFVPYPGIWNMTGQPACSVPAGFSVDGLPLAVQLVGRPDDEATLLSLAAEIEAERPWADHRPPID
jgi:amidase